MPVTFQNVPVSNTTPYQITLNDAQGNIVASLSPEGQNPQVLDLQFSSLSVIRPGVQPVLRNQTQPQGNIWIQPGNIAFLSQGGAGAIDVNYARPNQQQHQVIF